MAALAHSSECVTTSFNIPKDLLRKFQQRLPKKGDRSAVLNRMVELFVTDKLTVELPARRM